VPSPDDFRNVFVLTGPTGSGKSARALELAAGFGAEIVAMDSMTLYRGMDVGTAKPSAEDRRRVPHHLIDVLDPWESGSVAWWLDRAAEAVRDIERRGKRALVVGGTPLYLKALLYGLFEGPTGDPAVRGRLTAEAAVDGLAVLHARLANVDPATAARVHPNDLRRIVRALEVWELTGRPISAWQREWAAASTDPSTAPRNAPPVVCLDRPRNELYARTDRRVLEMLAAGWLDEVRRLRALPRPLGREAAMAVGYCELNDFLDRRLGWDDAVHGIRQRSRNYAKRQLTWFRHLPGVRFAGPELTTAAWG
jgi:tRNA dimethylallyltransferase